MTRQSSSVPVESESPAQEQGAEERSSSESSKHLSWTDTRLVQECVAGNEEAWSALIDKYKRLIFSIPIKYGLTSDEATDIFQNVCLELLSALPKLREPKALPKWIMQVTAHKCLRQKRHDQRFESSDDETEHTPEASIPAAAESVVHEAEEEHNLREAIGGMPDRCRHLVEMLFFEEPARPYKEIAERLGIATGSIGFIRQRCLDKLRKRLSETGFR
jgi:RNA polymerase sigma factor (sigma-70 family)